MFFFNLFADAAVPRLIGAGRLPILLIIVSIIEIIIFSIFLKKRYFYITIVVFIANIVTSILGILFLSGKPEIFNRFYLQENLNSLISIDFPLTIVIETPIIFIFLFVINKSINSQITKESLLGIILLANIASYIFLIGGMVVHSYVFPDDFAYDLRISVTRKVVGTAIRAQQAFHLEKDYFSSSFDELGFFYEGLFISRFKYPSTLLKLVNPYTLDSGHYTITLTANQNQSVITAKSKKTDSQGNVTGVIVSVKDNEYLQIFCFTDRNNLTTIPKAELIEGELKCTVGEEIDW